MKKYRLECSVDAIGIDYEEIIVAEKEPDWWTCEEIAREHGCEWWSIEGVRQENN